MMAAGMAMIAASEPEMLSMYDAPRFSVSKHQGSTLTKSERQKRKKKNNAAKASKRANRRK